MRKTQISSPAFGSTALLVIFAVLCLTMFSLLSLNTALAQQRLTDSALRSVTGYYNADLEAETIFARLRAGETVPGVLREDNTYSYRCTITQYQYLQVTLQKTAEGWQVLQWQAVAEPDPINETLPVWNGLTGEDTACANGWII